LEINRVCTWSKMNIAITTHPGKDFAWPSECYSTLELDINTAPEKFVAISGTVLSSILSELLEVGLHVAECGDEVT